MSEKQPKLWQHPFVNVLKLAKKNSNIEVKKSGDVTEIMDKICGKTCYEIKGSISANNYVQIPSNQAHHIGLTGNFIYIQLRLFGELHENISKQSVENFIFHIEVLTKDDSVIRLSFGNVFKNAKVNSYSLFVPMELLSTKWTVLAIDMNQILTEHFKRSFKHVKTFTFCSSLMLKNVYTSDLIYEVSSLPRDMYLPVPKSKKWEDLYDWIWYPSTPIAPLTEKMYHTPYSTTNSQSNSISPAIPILSKDVSTFIAKSKKVDPNIDKRKVMSPDPIMNIKQLIGVSTNSFSHILWSTDGQHIVYPCMKQIVIMNVKNKRQSILFGHTAKICAIAMDSRSRYLVSAQEGKIPLIRVWDISTKQCIGILKDHESDISCVAISDSGNMVAAVGRDYAAKFKFVVWDISQFQNIGHAMTVVKHSCDFPTAKIKFVPYDDNKLVSCGKENIRFWRIKRGLLKGCSLTAENGSLLRQNFLDMSFERAFVGSYIDNDHRIYVTTQSGAIYQVSYAHRRIECICQLHNGAIRTVDVNEGMCITGSDDKFLRVWPLDFSDYFIEAEHDASLNSAIISQDGLTVCIGIENGSIGLLDLTSQKYTPLLRSHSKTIFDIAVDPKRVHFSTVSQDLTIRVWDMLSFDQMKQFDITGEVPLCVCYHPEKPLLACGFNTGIVRIFDINHTVMLEQFKLHPKPIECILFTADSRWLLSASADSLCIVDCEHYYQPVKVIHYAKSSESVCIKLSADGKSLASVGPAGNIVHIFDTKNFDEKITFDTGSSDIFVDVVFSADSSELFGVTSDSRLLRISLKDGSISSEVTTPGQRKLTCICKSNNGKYIAVGCEDGIIQIWNAKFKTNSLPQSFVGHSSSVSNILFTENDTSLLSCGEDSIIAWEFNGISKQDLSLIVDNHIGIKEQRMQKIYDSDEDSIEIPKLDQVLRNIAEKQNEESIIASAQNSTPKTSSLHLWQLLGVQGGCDNLDWHPQQFVYTCGSFIIFERTDGTLQQHLFSADGPINFATVSSGKSFIASCSITNKSEASPISIWDYRSMTKLRSLTFHFNRIQYMAFSPDEKYLVSLGYEERSIVVWSVATGKIVATASAPSTLQQVCWFPEHKLTNGRSEFVTVGEDSIIFWLIDEEHSQLLMQPISTQQLGSIKISLSTTNPIVFTCCSFSHNPADETLWIGTELGAIIGFDVNNGTVNYCWKKAHETSILALLSIDNYIITCGADQEVRRWLWNINYDTKGKSTFSFVLKNHQILDSNISCIKLNDEDGILSTSNNSIWYLNWKDNTKTRIGTIHNSEICGIQSIEANNILVSASHQDSMIKIWRKRSKEGLYSCESQIRAITQDNRLTPINCINLSNSAIYLHYGSSDGLLRIMDITKMQLHAQVKLFNEEINFINGSRDESIMLCSSNQSDIVIIDTPNGKIRERISIYKQKGSAIISQDILQYSKSGVIRWCVLLSTGEIDVWEIIDSNHATLLSRNSVLPHEDISNVFCGKFSPHHEQSRIIIAMSHEILFFYDYMDQKILRQLVLSTIERPTCFSISPQCDYISVGTETAQIYLIPFNFEHNVESRSLPIQVYRGNNGPIKYLTYNDTGSKLISGSVSGEIAIFEANHSL